MYTLGHSRTLSLSLLSFICQSSNYTHVFAVLTLNNRSELKRQKLLLRFFSNSLVDNRLFTVIQAWLHRIQYVQWTPICVMTVWLLWHMMHVLGFQRTCVLVSQVILGIFWPCHRQIIQNIRSASPEDLVMLSKKMRRWRVNACDFVGWSSHSWSSPLLSLSPPIYFFPSLFPPHNVHSDPLCKLCFQLLPLFFVFPSLLLYKPLSCNV